MVGANPICHSKSREAGCGWHENPPSRVSSEGRVGLVGNRCISYSNKIKQEYHFRGMGQRPIPQSSSSTSFSLLLWTCGVAPNAVVVKIVVESRCEGDVLSKGSSDVASTTNDVVDAELNSIIISKF